MSPVIPGTRGRVSSLDDLLIYPLCIIGPLGPSKNSEYIGQGDNTHFVEVC